ncbi:MAG: hypothetical protein HQK53_10245 [Oligoflexia bacterium]|nr:hypothetical protein [Oligoflexia bacterium]
MYHFQSSAFLVIILALLIENVFAVDTADQKKLIKSAIKEYDRQKASSTSSSSATGTARGTAAGSASSTAAGFRYRNPESAGDAPMSIGGSADLGKIEDPSEIGYDFSGIEGSGRKMKENEYQPQKAERLEDTYLQTNWDQQDHSDWKQFNANENVKENSRGQTQVEEYSTPKDF